MTTLVEIAPGRQLAPEPAAAYLRARAAGCPAGLESAYRTPQRQAELRAAYLRDPKHHAYAAPVEDSEHVTGCALDLWAAAALWMRTHPEFGWVFTDPKEWWHVAYRPAADAHRNDAPPAQPAPAAVPIPLEDDDMLTLVQLLYSYYLDRPGKPSEWLGWTDQAATEGWNARQLHAKFRTSRAEAGTVRTAYREILHREADATELPGWSDGETIDDVWAGVAGSKEAQGIK